MDLHTYMCLYCLSLFCVYLLSTIKVMVTLFLWEKISTVQQQHPYRAHDFLVLGALPMTTNLLQCLRSHNKQIQATDGYCTEG